MSGASCSIFMLGDETTELRQLLTLGRVEGVIFA